MSKTLTKKNPPAQPAVPSAERCVAGAALLSDAVLAERLGAPLAWVRGLRATLRLGTHWEVGGDGVPYWLPDGEAEANSAFTAELRSERVGNSEGGLGIPHSEKNVPSPVALVVQPRTENMTVRRVMSKRQVVCERDGGGEVAVEMQDSARLKQGHRLREVMWTPIGWFYYGPVPKRIGDFGRFAP